MTTIDLRAGDVLVSRDSEGEGRMRVVSVGERSARVELGWLDGNGAPMADTVPLSVIAQWIATGTRIERVPADVADYSPEAIQQWLDDRTHAEQIARLMHRPDGV